MLEKLRTHLVRQGPYLLRLPLKLTPFFLQQQLLEKILNWQFQQALVEGELDFLESRWLKVEVDDLGLRWLMTIKKGRLVVSEHAQADVSFNGSTNDLILVAVRKQDPDTLFFQRRLRIEGDTELGLYIKNVMDSIALEAMPSVLRVVLLQLAAFIEAGLEKSSTSLCRGLQEC